MKLETRRRIAVVAGFAAFVAAGMAAAFLALQVPGFQLACSNRCAKYQKEGHLVYNGLATPKNTENQSECECR